MGTRSAATTSLIEATLQSSLPWLPLGCGRRTPIRSADPRRGTASSTRQRCPKPFILKDQWIHKPTPPRVSHRILTHDRESCQAGSERIQPSVGRSSEVPPPRGPPIASRHENRAYSPVDHPLHTTVTATRDYPTVSRRGNPSNPAPCERPSRPMSKRQLSVTQDTHPLRIGSAGGTCSGTARRPARRPSSLLDREIGKPIS